MPTRQQLLEIYQFVERAIVRHLKMGLKVFIVGAVLALLGAMFMPRSYYSEARLFVRFGRENQVDPTASGGQMVALYESRESEINSLIEILKSRAIFDRVVNELGPELVLSGRPASSIADSTSSNEHPSRAHQRAVAKLAKELS